MVKLSLERFDYNYLRLTEAYLVHDLSEHFSKFDNDYAAFRRFVQNCWWLELVKASTSDASNASLREHQLLADSIYQIHLTAVDRFGVDELGGKKAKAFIRYRMNKVTMLNIEGRPKDFGLRIKNLQLLEHGEGPAYQIWKDLKVLNQDGDKRYSLNISLAPRHSFTEARYGLPSDEKLRGAIIELHSAGFSTDGIAYELGLPELHILEVINEQKNQK